MNWRRIKESTPEYPHKLGKKVAKFRELVTSGLQELSLAERREYGNAVLAAIRTKQRQELQTGGWNCRNL